MTAVSGFRVGVTLHSFAQEYLNLQWSFEDLMQMAGLLGGGVEIVGPSHHRGFPYVTDEFECQFKGAVERYHLTPTCYGTYADPYMLQHRNLTPDELVEYTIPQLQGAHKLGFTLVRLQYFVYPVIERLLPYAEKYNLKMGYEMHVPLTFESPRTQELLRQVEHISSEHLGMIPDCGIFARSVPQFAKDNAVRRGIPENLVNHAVELWKAKVPLKEALDELTSRGLEKSNLTVLERFWGSFGQSNPESLLDIMPYIIHIHGKFFSMVDGDEPDIRFEEVVQALLKGGYTGWLSSEFEGNASDSFEVLKAHQEMLHHYIRANA